MSPLPSLGSSMCGGRLGVVASSLRPPAHQLRCPAQLPGCQELCREGEATLGPGALSSFCAHLQSCLAPLCPRRKDGFSPWRRNQAPCFNLSYFSSFAESVQFYFVKTRVGLSAGLKVFKPPSWCHPASPGPSSLHVKLNRV